MKSLIKTPASKTVVRFVDCDPFNHLNNSRYLDYMMSAREDHLLEYYDFDPFKTAKETGFGWLVSKHKIVYLKPANLRETVLIQTAILEFAEKHILVEMQMWDEGATQLKALLWTTYTHFNFATGRSAVHSGELRNTFENLALAEANKSSFNQRLEQVIKDRKQNDP